MRQDKKGSILSKNHAPFSRSMRDVAPSETMANIKEMEQRYAFENEMMHAVEHGQMQFEERFSAASYTAFFEKRATDPVRNVKNYAVIMNTLLRKAAERGGVHPIYLDQVSSEYALQIENGSNFSEVSDLMHDMFCTYCRLVREHSGKGYSLIVQNTILMIDADLSADISPRALAAAQNVTPAYLSTVFHRETGKTVSAYIRERRMESAAHLLATTKLQIQTVALHCGIMDVQYFSKLFKMQYGVTPTQYRNTVMGVNA